MFHINRINDTPTLQDQINTILSEMESNDPDSNEYAALLVTLERLYKLLPPKKENAISKDAVLAVAGNLLGILLILNFEKAGVVTSKAVGFILKSKL